MRTELLSDMITNHSQRIGALRPNQEFEVSDVNVDGDVTVVEGILIERTAQ